MRAARSGRPEDRVSLGGGSVLSERVQAALARHTVVLLEVDAETAWERASGRHRPLARDRDAFAKLHAERSGLYERLADAIVPARRESLANAVPALEALRTAPPGTRLLWAGSAAGTASEYPVYIGRGLLDAPPWPIPSPPARRLVVSDETVGALYGDRLTHPESLPLIVPGEQSKATVAEAERLWAELASRGVTRPTIWSRSAAAWSATWPASRPRPTSAASRSCTCRRRSWPRSTRPMGYAVVDLPRPRTTSAPTTTAQRVTVDPAALAAGSAAERAAGYAEVVKTALIAGGLWGASPSGADRRRPGRDRSAPAPLAIVAADERDGGLRQVLNLGHTVAHAIETVTATSATATVRPWRWGCWPRCGSRARTICAQVGELLASHGLPTRLVDVDPAAIVAATTRDKKRTAARVPFVLVREPGDVSSGHAVGRRAARGRRRARRRLASLDE